MKTVLSFAALLYVLHVGPGEVVRNVVSIASAAGVLPVQLVSQ